MGLPPSIPITKDAMEVLLKSGVSHSIGNNDLDTPLILAAKSWQLAAVKLLLAYVRAHA